MDRLRRFVEIGSNIAVILVAVLLGYSLVNRYYSQPAQPTPAAESLLKPGIKLQIEDLDFSKSDRNLVLVLSTTCNFCSESMPFYRRLVELNADKSRLRVIGAFMQDLDKSVKYLNEHEVSLDKVIKADPSEMMAKGTPTLILTDKNGVVLYSWYGKLKPDRENEVVDRAFSNVQPVAN